MGRPVLALTVHGASSRLASRVEVPPISRFSMARSLSPRLIPDRLRQVLFGVLCQECAEVRLGVP